MRKNIIIGAFLAIILFIGSILSFPDTKEKNNDKLYKQVELFSDTLAVIQKEYV